MKKNQDDDMVMIKLLKERGGKNLPKRVFINEKKYDIPRGVNTPVPRCVYELLEHEELMLEKGDKYRDQFLLA